MNRAYYSDPIATFLPVPGRGAWRPCREHQLALETSQRDAWKEQIEILHQVLPPYRDVGHVYFEYLVPRLGKRIDVILLIRHVLFVVEFKVGESEFPSHARDQVWDYAWT